jgi:hypothetical protein
MKTTKIIFVFSLIVASVCVMTGFFGLADLIQWVIHFPDSFTYWTFNNRIWLMVLGSVAFILSIGLNIKGKYLSKWIIGIYGILYISIFMSGFIAPSYLMFRSEHYIAEYLPTDQITNSYLMPEDEVIVMVIHGDARAYPNKWIVQPHIAGDIVGGEEVVMTYCGLSHVGQAYKSSIDGVDLDLKVMTQLKNNLVMFDNCSKEPIPQVYGTLENSGRYLDQIASTVMPYSSFKKLYPEGKVYHYTHKNAFDKLVYLMLDHAIYRKGGQYDKSTEPLSFPSIKYEDSRLHPKEQVYGINIDGESVAYTLSYLVKNGGTVTEKIGDKDITVKYFEEFDFVNIYPGRVIDISPNGFVQDRYFEPLPHHNRILWKVWANFFRDTDVRI